MAQTPSSETTPQPEPLARHRQYRSDEEHLKNLRKHVETAKSVLDAEVHDLPLDDMLVKIARALDLNNTNHVGFISQVMFGPDPLNNNNFYIDAETLERGEKYDRFFRVHAERAAGDRGKRTIVIPGAEVTYLQASPSSVSKFVLWHRPKPKEPPASIEPTL